MSRDRQSSEAGRGRAFPFPQQPRGLQSREPQTLAAIQPSHVGGFYPVPCPASQAHPGPGGAAQSTAMAPEEPRAQPPTPAWHGDKPRRGHGSGSSPALSSRAGLQGRGQCCQFWKRYCAVLSPAQPGRWRKPRRAPSPLSSCTVRMGWAAFCTPQARARLGWAHRSSKPGLAAVLFPQSSGMLLSQHGSLLFK